MNANNIRSGCYCGGKETRIIFGTTKYTILRCGSCGQVRTHLFDASKAKHEYLASDTRIYVEKEKEFRRLFKKIIHFIQRFVPSGRLVDIGAGVGLLVQEARRAGFDAIGFEPSSASARVAKELFGVKLIHSEFDPKSIVKQVDVVVLNHVLEHLDDPMKIIGEIHLVLSVGGILVIGVPNFGNIIARLKKERWQSLIPDQHRWQFTNTSLDRLVISHGFVRVGTTSDNHDRAMHPWWKRPLYFIHDQITSRTASGEAILVAYKKL